MIVILNQQPNSDPNKISKKAFNRIKMGKMSNKLFNNNNNNNLAVQVLVKNKEHPTNIFKIQFINSLQKIQFINLLQSKCLKNLMQNYVINIKILLNLFVQRLVA